MRKMKAFVIASFVMLALSIAFLRDPQLFSAFLIAADVMIVICLYMFLKNYKTKRIGNIIVEHIQYPFTFVLRAYTKPKRVWIVYDYKAKKFRPADWKHMPIRALLILLIGAALIYTSYLIALTITQALFLIFFRATLLFLFLIVGLYSLSLGLYRMFSFNNKKAEAISKLLNRNRFLRSQIEKGEVYVQISPNFMTKQGFVDSVEFVLSEKADAKKLEKMMIEIAKSVQKL